MEAKNFTTTIEVVKSAKEVFNDINNVSAWWHGKVDGTATKLNDEFTYRMKEVHFSKQKVVEFVPYKKVVWFITDSHLNFIEDKNEWTGTKVSFEITELNNKTQVHFTHTGLTPDVECYGACTNGWSQIIHQSLFSLITSGKGKEVFK